MRRLAWVFVAAVLVAGCGGDSDDNDGGGDSGSSGQSAGDKQYIDPFQECLTKRQVQEKVFRIAARIPNEKRRERAIEAVRERAC